MTTGSTITRLLQGLRRRVLCIDALAGVAWGLLAAGGCLLAGVWLDLVLDLPPALRIATLVSAAATALALVTVVIVHGLARSRPALLARRLDEVGGTRGQILSGVDLASGPPPAFQSHDPGLTGALAGMAVLRAERLAAEVPAARAIPIRPVARAWGLFGGFTAGVVILAVLMPRLAATEWRRFFSPFDDHPPWSLVSFAVEPGDATVLYGDGLDIRVTVHGPAVEGLELVMRPETAETDRSPAVDEILPMFAEPGGGWRASLSNLTVPTRYWIRARQARSEKFTISIITVPRFEDVKFRIIPPAYTRASEYSGPLPQGGLAGLPGTRVEVRARSNRPLSGGRLIYVTDEERREMPLQPAGDDREVTGAFEISASGRIELVIRDADGQPSTEPWSAPVVQLVDERPFVRLLQPPAVSFATPTAVVPVAVAAEDDYGIARLQLFRGLNDSRALPLELAVADPPEPRAYQVVSLPLAEYGLEPGDEIKLFARVEDNDPSAHADGEGSAGKGSESSVVLVRIIAQEEFDRMLRTREGIETLLSKYQQARRRMESLASEIETLQQKLAEQPQDAALRDELRRELEQLARRMQDETEAIQKLQDASLPFELDQQLSEHLEQLAETLRQQTEQAQSLAQNPDLTHRQTQAQLARMLEQLSADRERLDSEAMRPLEMTAAALKLAQCESRFVQLYRRQRDLAERLASLKDRGHVTEPALKARIRDLEAEQRQLRAELDRLLNDIEEQAHRLPEDEAVEEFRRSALEFVEAVRASGADEAMLEAEAGLAEFSGTRGHAGAKEAADILERFLGQCQGIGEGAACQACRRFSPGLGNAMCQTIEQLMAGMRPGSGPGFGPGGSGDGYSAQTNSLQNVGLFGGVPLMDAASSGQGMSDQSQAAAGRGGAARPFDGRRPSAYAGAASPQAAGSGEAAVPLSYRRKVGRYFQRIADEIGDQ